MLHFGAFGTDGGALGICPNGFPGVCKHIAQGHALQPALTGNHGVLLQIDGDSLTPAAIDRTIRGCGIRARALEMGGGQLRVIFPEVAGEPEDFDQIRKIILDILPCHLEVEFYFRYLTWAECEAAGYTWGQVEAAEYTWESFQLAVPPER